MAIKEPITRIVVRRETAEKLKQLKRWDDTYDDVITTLIEEKTINTEKGTIYKSE